MGKLVYADIIINLDGRDAVILGRHREADLAISDGSASRQHCKVLCDGGRWFLQDLDSANGTLLNGKPVHGREPLQHEDVIAIGKSRIQVQLPETAAEPVEQVKRSAAAQGVLGNPDTLVGRKLGGFVLRQVTGRSPLGAVFRAEQPALARDAWVTVVAPEALADLGTPAEALTALTSQRLATDPGLPERFDCGLDDELGLIWIASAALPGETLTVVAGRGTVGPLEAVLMIERVAKVLAAVHAAGGVYGLLDGDAAMLSDDGRIRLRDPGVAGALVALSGGAVSSDPAYRAPEARTDVAGDLYALGCVFHLLLTGRTPYRASSPYAWRAAHRDNPIPSIAALHPTQGTQLDHLLQGLLAKNPEWRYHSIAEFLAELAPVREALAAGTEAPRTAGATPAASKSAATTQARTLTPSAGVMERASERLAEARQRRRVRISLGVVLIAVAIIGLWQWAKRMPTHTPADASTTVGEAGRPALPFMAGAQRRDPPLRTTPQVSDTPLETGHASLPEPATATDDSWPRTQEQVESFLASHDYGAAELAVQAALSAAPPASDRQREIQRVADRVRRQGQAWYQRELAPLTGGSEAHEIVASLQVLTRLRDAALRADRLDAASRYDEARERLRQHLAGSRRDARILLESSNPAALARLADAVQTAFAGAPAMSDLRAFLAQCRQAATLAQRYPDQPWAVVRSHLKQATGADALAAAAALLLVGDAATATALLNRPELTEPPLVIEREALHGREAAVLAFEHPSDLRFIETVLGEPRLAGGALTGPRGEPVGLRCSVPIGGDDWEVGLTLHVRDVGSERATVLVSCGTSERRDVQVQMSSTEMRIRVRAADGWSQQDSQRPAGAQVRLGLRCRAGILVVSLNGAEIFTVRAAQLASGAQFGLDVFGADWRLDDLRVVGG